jgi:O-acetyl-ADP-ribose deacetylase (regulator of RNase III)
MSITYLTGDATQPVGDGMKIITHCCNDEGGWGRGFVLALSQRWPKAEQEYRRWFRTGLPVLGAVQYVRVDDDVCVANIIGQHGVRVVNGVPPIRYEAIEKGLVAVNRFALAHKATVHAPRFGAGLAGGEWGRIEEILQRTVTVPVTIYDL